MITSSLGRTLPALLTALALSGCGGGGGGTTTGATPPGATTDAPSGTSTSMTTTGSSTSSASTPPTAASDPDAYFTDVIGPGYENYRDTLIGDSYSGATAMPKTAYDGMPNSGTATYNGYALLGVNRDGDVAGQPRIGVEGTATLTVDFAAGTASGSATNFVGNTVGDQNPTTGKYPLSGPSVAFPGTIQISNGCVGKDCAGVSRPNEMSAQFSGTLTGLGHTITTSGQALGDFHGTPIKGVALIANSITSTVDGTGLPSEFGAFVKP